MDNRVDKLLKKLEYLKSGRTTWEQIWQYIADRFDPKNSYMVSDYIKGQPPSGAQSFDSTASLSVPKWASAIDGLTTPKATKWHTLKLTNRLISQRFSRYLEEWNEILFDKRYSYISNFSNANFEALKTVGFYGGSPFSVTAEGKNIIYKNWAIKEFYIDQNFKGDIDTFYRVYEADKRQLRQEFGDNLLPKSILNSQEMGKQFKILHAVFPNEYYDGINILAANKKWASVYLAIDEREIIEESGFDTCPYIYQRLDVMPSLSDPYGYSLLMYCLPDIRSLNLMMRDNLRTSNRMANPSLLMTEDDMIDASQITPGMLVPGGLDSQGSPRVKPLYLPGDVPFSLEFIKEFRDNIKQNFNLELFEVLVNKRDMTATEILRRMEERATLMTPTTSRREHEFLGPLITREIDLIEKMGDAPQMPEELAYLIATGQTQITVEYESPIRRAQKAEEATAILQVMQTASGLQQFDPSIKNMINAPRVLLTLSNVWGAPNDMFNTEDEREEKDEQDAMAAQAQQILAAAPVLSQSAKNIADATASQPI